MFENIYKKSKEFKVLLAKLKYLFHLFPCLCSFLHLSLGSSPLWRMHKHHAHDGLSPSVGVCDGTLH